MKNNKKKSPMMKIVSAAAMLAVSASMLGTSTYAWFSMNTTVTVTGMQVKAKSNNSFLLIGEGSLADANAVQAQTGGDLITEAITMTDDESVVYPSSPVLAAYVSDSTTTNAATHKYFASGTAVVSNASTASTVTNWFTAQNNDPTSSNNSVKNVNKLNADDSDAATLYDFSDYVIKKTFKLTLADGSDTAHGLTVTPTIDTKTTTPAQTADDISAVKVLVATGDNYAILNSTMNGTAQSLSTTDFNITDSGVAVVDVYIYYDGEEAAVRTENVADLAFATVDLAFDVSVGSAT